MKLQQITDSEDEILLRAKGLVRTLGSRTFDELAELIDLAAKSRNLAGMQEFAAELGFSSLAKKRSKLAIVRDLKSLFRQSAVSRDQISHIG